ncbi:MAG TPA: winged helix-turn-helix domain-containing protein [Candidatus Acidoferrales bacterium]|nr:winged helix-turn-helix domain-containing protein [Candidatus Acidoferrales bacterium]
MSARAQYDFGPFFLDASERTLACNGRPVALPPKAYDLLVALVENAGRLLSKRELLDLVWPDSFVEEGILAVHVSSLRKALGEDAIHTVPRSGYRFTASVTRRDTTLRPPRRITHPEVYELFGQGRAHLLSASLFDVPKAIEAFRAALQLEPEYAEAHAGLALAHCAQAELRLMPAAEAYGDARAAALRALAMDDACADAQAALGAVLFLSDWNWSGARRSLERALQLNPNHTEAYLLYGRLLEALGDLRAGLESKQKALERDPFSAQVHVQIALSYFCQRRYDQAICWANKALELDRRHLLAREVLAGAFLKMGDTDRHMAEVLRHAEAAGAPPEALEPLKQVYASGGRRAIVNLAIDRASQQQSPNTAIVLAIHHAEAGNLDAAFQHLERAMESHDPSLVYLAVGPQWDDLRADPRFDSCLARMGLR